MHILLGKSKNVLIASGSGSRSNT